jgi:hypothetical protein
VRIKHEYVDFRISRRTLWVGMQAFPLPQVTRVVPIEIKPNRKRTVLTYTRRSGATIGLGVAGLVVLSCAGDTVPPVASVICVALTLLAVGLHTFRLVRGLTRPPLYILSVATAGSPRAALCSTDRKLIYDLTYRVVDAIDNPAAEFEISVEHLEIVQGNRYGGDHIEGDKIVEGWG